MNNKNRMQNYILLNSLENGIVSKVRSLKPDDVMADMKGCWHRPPPPLWKGNPMMGVKVIIAVGGGEVDGC